MNFMRRASTLVILAIVMGCAPSGPTGPSDPSSGTETTPFGTPRGTTPAPNPPAPETGLWGCVMCPAVQSRASGACPTCGMRLKIRHGTGAFVCLEHAEDGAMDLEPGACRQCGKPFEAALTRLVYGCSTHEQVLAESKGACAVCGKELRAQRMALIWECDEHGFVSLDGGRCATCETELFESLVALPHGDHSPRHGGLFFMAPNRWHHVEGTLPADDTFRLYLYDNFTRPISTEGVSGFVQVGQVSDDGDVVLAEKRHVLHPVKGTNYFEVASSEFRLPLDLALSLDLSGGKSEPDRFDFTFAARSKEPGGTGSDPPPPIDIEIEIPETRKGILRAIDERRDLVRRSIEARRLALLYKPALEAKQLTLALEAYAKDVPAEKETEFARALYQSVRGAWLLDVHGDLGELEKVREAYEVFVTGLDRLKTIFSSGQ